MIPERDGFTPPPQQTKPFPPLFVLSLRLILLPGRRERSTKSGGGRCCSEVRLYSFQEPERGGA